MSEKILTPIIDMVEANPNVDNRKSFNRLWAITEAMMAKILSRFELNLDPCSDMFQNYKDLPGTAGEGALKAYSGPEVDWLIHSYIGSPEETFTNMHITLSLGPQYDVPNFGFALGTVPDVFMYMDYIPRKDLLAHPEYADKYYEPVNEEFLMLQDHPKFRPFISRDLYTRIAMTPTAVGYCADHDDEVFAIIETIAMERLERWLEWVDDALPTPEADRPAIMIRDEKIRQTICERDPANNLGERLFGKDAADKMVATLWGGRRTLPRPDGSGT
ncbi:red chlorophyll catabolite reductase [Paraferrimonas sp. SM1919]|uniref:red chlorophyll catabolite reductase n=1 Tax=Paraferrimonas sp. SM1919 TaxID=2662263 RepID=UPI0013D60FFF|nr:red chlorophyll catabolite reductase [Paraferrimonas sp. SM1919]